MFMRVPLNKSNFADETNQRMLDSHMHQWSIANQTNPNTHVLLYITKFKANPTSIYAKSIHYTDIHAYVCMLLGYRTPQRIFEINFFTI